MENLSFRAQRGIPFTTSSFASERDFAAAQHDKPGFCIGLGLLETSKIALNTPS